VVSRELTLGNLLGRQLLDIFGELYQQGTNQSTNTHEALKHGGRKLKALKHGGRTAQI
jgi:hypothetical protein